MNGTSRGYVILPQDDPEFENPGLVLVRYMPVFLWCVWYLQSEGIKDIVIVSNNAQVYYIATGLHYPVINHIELEIAAINSVDFVIRLTADVPFHEPGKLQEMLELAKVHRRVATRGGEIEVQNLHATPDMEEKVLVLQAPYDLTTTTWKDKLAIEYIATKDGRKLLPHPIKTIAVVQNQQEYTRNYSAFIDSCDLVCRGNIMDNYISELYGTRCDVLHLSCWEQYAGYIAYFTALQKLYAAIPLIYAKELRYIAPVKLPYIFPFADAMTDAHQWSVALTAVHMLLTAFPEAQIYTTSIATRKISAYLHLAFGDEEYLWDYLEASGKVIDIMREDVRENYSDMSFPEYLEFVTVDSGNCPSKILINRKQKYCRDTEDQDFGKLLEYKNGRLRIYWLGADTLWEGHISSKLSPQEMTNPEFRKTVTPLCSTDKKCCITVAHTYAGWEEEVILWPHKLRGRRTLIQDKFSILIWKPKNCLRVKWDKYGEEKFVYNPATDVYCYEK